MVRNFASKRKSNLIGILEDVRVSGGSERVRTIVDQGEEGRVSAAAEDYRKDFSFNDRVLYEYPLSSTSSNLFPAPSST